MSANNRNKVETDRLALARPRVAAPAGKYSNIALPPVDMQVFDAITARLEEVTGTTWSRAEVARIASRMLARHLGFEVPPLPPLIETLLKSTSPRSVPVMPETLTKEAVQA